MMMGVAIRKEKCAESPWLMPRNRPPTIVEPEREMPGSNAGYPPALNARSVRLSVSGHDARGRATGLVNSSRVMRRAYPGRGRVISTPETAAIES